MKNVQAEIINLAMMETLGLYKESRNVAPNVNIRKGMLRFERITSRVRIKRFVTLSNPFNNCETITNVSQARSLSSSLTIVTFLQNRPD